MVTVDELSKLTLPKLSKLYTVDLMPHTGGVMLYTFAIAFAAMP